MSDLPPPPASQRRALRLLLVEDSADEADLLVRELTRGGFDVACHRVETGAALLAALEVHAWDLVISDFAMPHFDGLSAFRMVQERARELPFIFVSGVLGEERAVEAMRHGARDYLLKGSLGRLTAAVARELDEAAARRQRREAQERLRVEERRYRSIFDSTAVALAELDFSADEVPRVLDANQAMVRLLEASDRGEALRAFVPALGEADGPVWTALLAALRDPGGRRELQREVELRTSSGRKVPALLSLRIPAAAADFQNVVVSLLDVSEQRRMAERMREAQRLETLGKLAGGVAHDFNNVLAVIGSFAGILRDELADNAAAQRDLDAITEATRRAAALTGQLLTFSRRQVQELRTVDLNRVVDELGRMLRRVIGDDLELDWRPAAAPQLVRADTSQLEQVLMNLVVNARDAMPSGGRITIETATRDVAPGGATVPAGRYVVLTVSDTGLGMDEEVRRRAFEPFFTTKGPGKGAGMGLSTVYGIVKQSGGHIEVQSAPGRGARFEISLPRVAPEEASPAGPEEGGRPAARAPGGSETILLVENDELLRKAARRILEGEGYRVLDAASGEDALRAAESHGGAIHLLLTDVRMPRMNGRDLARLVQLTRPQVKVLYLGDQGGAADEIAKPFAAATLLAAIRAALDVA